MCEKRYKVKFEIELNMKAQLHNLNLGDWLRTRGNIPDNTHHALCDAAVAMVG